MLGLVGANSGIVQLIAQVERAKLVGDGASYMSSSKTITDHALSSMFDQDCKVFNVFDNKSLCATKTAANSGYAPEPAPTAAAMSTTVPQQQTTLDYDVRGGWFPSAKPAASVAIGINPQFGQATAVDFAPGGWSPSAKPAVMTAIGINPQLGQTTSIDDANGGWFPSVKPAAEWSAPVETKRSNSQIVPAANAEG
ncbi:MAG: hypothetical protein JWN94_1922 [Betaproteobacteria bacterium]|nr:hypothetical protein [Betaproteobacteria bacterium]